MNDSSALPERLNSPTPQFLRIKDVCKLIGLSKSTVWNKLDPDSKYYDPDFPSQIRISRKAVAWDKNELIDWMNKARIRD